MYPALGKYAAKARMFYEAVVVAAYIDGGAWFIVLAWRVDPLHVPHVLLSSLQAPGKASRGILYDFHDRLIPYEQVCWRHEHVL
jgi:hypothetical protein